MKKIKPQIGYALIDKTGFIFEFFWFRISAIGKKKSFPNYRSYRIAKVKITEIYD